MIGLDDDQYSSGYNRDELLEGRYRPVFSSSIKGYSISKSKAEEYKNKKALGRGYAIVKPTKENIIKMAKFNITYGDPSYQEAGRKVLELITNKNKKYHEQDLWRDREIKAKTIRTEEQPTWRGDLKGKRI